MQVDNFIGIFENALPPQFCTDAINYFENMKAQGFGLTRQQVENTSKLDKDDETVFMHYESVISIDGTQRLSAELNSALFNQCYAAYADKFSILRQFEKHGNYYSRLQKTAIGGGYHTWHPEIGNRYVGGRLLAWMVYLNDVEEGGETEFLYLHKRVKPKAGTLLIWPAGFTHTHRGNPPISNEKYILTGWIEF